MVCKFFWKNWNESCSSTYQRHHRKVTVFDFFFSFFVKARRPHIHHICNPIWDYQKSLVRFMLPSFFIEVWITMANTLESRFHIWMDIQHIYHSTRMRLFLVKIGPRRKIQILRILYPLAFHNYKFLRYSSLDFCIWW